VNQARQRILSRLPSIVFLLVALASASFAQSGKLPSATQQRIENEVTKFMAVKKIPGLSVAVVENGTYVWSNGFGMADLENSVPATPQTLYRLASVSKPITAVAALQLWQQGKLDLDVPVQKYCPAFPVKEGGPINTRELLSHFAGIRHYHLGKVLDPLVGSTKHLKDPIKEGLDFFKNDPLVSKPGTEFHYSTYGYTLVGCVIEGASDEKYVDYISKEVLAPSGMKTAQVDDRLAVIAHRTRFYQKERDRVENADFLDSSYKIPGGGWLASAEDMARFEVAILNDKLVNRQTRDLMWTARYTKGEKSYALGWGITKQGDELIYSHSGGQQGTSTFIAVAPQQKAGIVVLSNLEESDADDLGKELMKMLLGH
jgi:CubicO group peptidase (beta-lactamase class C family)